MPHWAMRTTHYLWPVGDRASQYLDILNDIKYTEFQSQMGRCDELNNNNANGSRC